MLPIKHFLIVFLSVVITASAAPGLAPAFIVAGGETIVASAVGQNVDHSGQRDASAAIQRALDTVAAANGGVVFLPAGKYRLEHGLTIGYGTTLMGDSGKTLLLGYERKRPLLDATGSETGLIHLEINYPGQQAGHIEPYPPTIRGNGALTLRDILLDNSYEGVHLTSLNACVLENIRGTVLRRGIVAPESEEFSWMRDIHFANKWWGHLTRQKRRTLDAFTSTNLIGLELQRIDCAAIDHYAADDAATAVLMTNNPKFPALVFGFGGVVSDFGGPRREEKWAPWYYYMHYANLDRVPEAKGKHYQFASAPIPRITTLESFVDTALPPYSATGDGVTDDTAAITHALNDAGRRGGGTVYLRQGEYKITAPLTVPAGVELRGPMGTGKARDGRETCSLAIYCGQDTAHPNTDDAAITLLDHAGVRGFTVVYPSQAYDVKELHPFPFTIRGEGTGVWVVDMMLLNSFNGIDLGRARCDRHLVQGVWGTVFATGVNVGSQSKDGKLERITFSCGPWTEAVGRLGPRRSAAGTAAIMERIMQGNMAFEFGDCTGESGWGLFAFEPNVHFHFQAGPNGGCRDAEFWLSMHDMARRCTVLAEGGANIDLLGYFSTGLGEQKYNWLEVTPSFNGPLTVYGKTVLRNFQNHPFGFSEKQVRFYDEVSLAAGARASSDRAAGGHGPANAVDRNFRTWWEAPAGSVLDVDLGRQTIIDRFGIECAGLIMAGGRNTVEAELWASRDGKEYQKTAVLETGGAAWADMPFAPLAARYVRLKVTKPGADNIIRVLSFDVYAAGQEAASRLANRPAAVEFR